MQKRLCRLCGERHLNSEPHVFGPSTNVPETSTNRSETTTNTGPTKPAASTNTATNTDPGLSSSALHIERTLRWRGKNRERYNAYQRELMRRRRATL